MFYKSSNNGWYARIHRGYWLIIITVLLLAGIGRARADEPALIYVDVAAETAVIGEHIPTVINIENVDDGYGVELHFKFDPVQVQIVDADNDISGIQVSHGDFFDAGQGFLVVNEADNDAGEMVYAFTLLSPAEPVSGDGTLVTFDLEAISDGGGLLELTSVIIASPDGESLLVTSQNDQVDTVNEQLPATTVATNAAPPTTVQSTPHNTNSLAESEVEPTVAPAIIEATPPAPSPTAAVQGEVVTTIPVEMERSTDTLSPTSAVVEESIDTPVEIASTDETGADMTDETIENSMFAESQSQDDGTSIAVIGADAPATDVAVNSPSQTSATDTRTGLMAGIIISVLTLIIAAYLLYQIIQRRSQI